MASFYELDPDLIINATEKCGFLPTGEFTQLNSYENRVFDIVLEDKNRVIAKFYRPHRWTKNQILEEHSFLADLKNEGIPAVAPLKLKNGTTVEEIEGILVSYFPKVLGRLPQEFLQGDLKSVGRLLAKIHNIGANKKFLHRPYLDEAAPQTMSALEILKSFVSPEIWPRYHALAESIIYNYFEKMNPENFIRIHGDCHRGNLLHNGDEFFIVDFDDSLMGPPVQDFWMLFGGQDSEISDLDELLSGYSDLREFDEGTLELIPLLQGIRIISYAAWIAKRWDDPFFKKTFPQFGTYEYWCEELEALNKI